MDFFDSNFFLYILLPFLIFLSRIGDVTIGTIRIILVSKGNKLISPLLGFFEVLIWLIAITRIFEHLDNWLCYFAYAAGFATGNFVGVVVEEKLALGNELIRIITRHDASELIKILREKGYGITSLKAQGSAGDVGVIYCIIKRSNQKDFIMFMKKYNPNAFYTIEDIRMVNRSLNPINKSVNKRRFFKVRK
jgi:uncharacterized protein YebE (UPF0316 family)